MCFACVNAFSERQQQYISCASFWNIELNFIRHLYFNIINVISYNWVSTSFRLQNHEINHHEIYSSNIFYFAYSTQWDLVISAHGKYIRILDFKINWIMLIKWRKRKFKVSRIHTSSLFALLYNIFQKALIL